MLIICTCMQGCRHCSLHSKHREAQQQPAEHVRLIGTHYHAPTPSFAKATHHNDEHMECAPHALSRLLPPLQQVVHGALQRGRRPWPRGDRNHRLHVPRRLPAGARRRFGAF